jgi:hypothetical protein
MSDERKIHDLSLRRQQQLQDDPTLKLANELTKLVADTAGDMEPANQLVAIELTARAMFETIRHARGEDALNGIVVEFQNKCRFYTMEWPQHDQTKTVYDIDRNAEDERTPAKVVLLAPKEPEE